MNTDTNTNVAAGDTTQTPPASPSYSPEDIANAVRGVMDERESQQNQPPAELSPEQRDQFMKVWNPDDNFHNSWNQAFAEGATPEQRNAAFVALRSGMMQQAQRYSDLLVDHRMNALLQRFEPVMKHYQDTQRQTVENTFYGEYPALKEFPEIVRAVAADLASKGTTAETPAKARQIIAKGVETVLKKLNPGFTLPMQETQEKPVNNPGGMPPMATLSGGGNGGGTKPTNGAVDEFSIWKK